MNIYLENSGIDNIKIDADVSRTIKTINQDLSIKIVPTMNELILQQQNQRDRIGELLGKIQSRRDKTKIEIQRNDYSEAEIAALVKITQQEVQHRTQGLLDHHKDEEQLKKQTEVMRRRTYIDRFKKYLKMKRSRLLQKEQFKLEQDLNKQTETTQRWVTSTKNEDNDKLMFEFFFTQIDKKSKGSVHEIQVKQFLFDNPLIMKLFNLKREGLQGEMEKFPRTIKNHFNLDEMIKFFLKYSAPSLPGLKSFVHIFDDLNIQIGSPTQFRICLLSEEHLSSLQQVFDSVDVNKVSIVDQDTFFHEIRQMGSPSPLFKNALHVVSLNLNLILESVLQYIDIDSLDEDDKMISWNQFMGYLYNFPDVPDTAEPQEESIQHKDEEEYFYSRMIPTSELKSASPVKQTPPPIVEVKKQKKTKRTKSYLNHKSFFLDLGVVFRPHRVVDSKITVPRPLSYEKRRQNHTPGLREQWVQELVAEKRKEQEECLKYRPFKANKVPHKVQDKKYYNELLEKEELRRREIKARSLQKMQETTLPFSFYERDKGHKEQMLQEMQDENQRKEESEKFQFKANPIPWFCSLQLFQRDKNMKDEQRQMKKKIRQQWLMMNSALPTRMQEHIDREQIKGMEQDAEKTDIIGGHEFTFQPKEPKPVPDFDTLHKEWEIKLSESKRAKKVTQPIQPNFHVSKKTPQLQYLDQENVLRTQSAMKEDPMKKAKKALSRKPKMLPSSTKKYEAQIERVRQEKEYKQMLEQRQLYEDQQRFEKKQLFVPRVQNSWAIANHGQMHEQLRYQKLVQYYLQQKQQEEDFNTMMKDIFLRVYQKPLLMETASMPLMQEGEGEEGDQQGNEENQNIQQNYGYGMNPIGEDDELEYMRQQEEDQLQEEQQQNGYDNQQEEEDENQQQEDENEEQLYQDQDEQVDSPHPNYDNNQEDPEGVDLVGDEAEGSGDEVEFAQEDYAQDYDGEEYIDMDNISPELLKQLQEQALAEGYELNFEDQEDDQEQQEEEDEEDNNQGFGYMQHHRSF